MWRTALADVAGVASASNSKVMLPDTASGTINEHLELRLEVRQDDQSEVLGVLLKGAVDRSRGGDGQLDGLQPVPGDLRRPGVGRRKDDVGAFLVSVDHPHVLLIDQAESITAEINIPTIGIGAGPACDGQVLVFHDILGLFDQFTPKFVKQYANLREPILNAIRTYRQEVESGAFPTDSHSF